jgi:colanic acid/amylovoran biosynthesis glycosyltransferase
LEAERFLRLRRAKLLHAHFGLHGIWGLRMRRALGLPLVTTFYGHDLSRDSYVASCRRGYLELFKEGSLFLVEGPHMRDRLEALGCPSEKIIIQRIAIPISRMPYLARKPKVKEKKAVIIFSGRFVEKKGLLIALQALHNVWRRRTDFEFRVIGDGPLRPEVERFIRDHEMGLCVRLLGFLDYRSYQEQMIEADLFLHPSVTAADGDSEGGAPTTILEAQALGLPIISTFHADIPHVVLPGASALLSAEKDIAGLTANIMRLLENRDLWARMGEAGRRHVAQFHDMDREGVRLERIYDDLIEAARKQG